MDLSRFGPKVVYFSDTTGGGVHGAIVRLRHLAEKSPGRLVDDLRRKWRRRRDPFATLPFAQAIHIEVTNACNLRCVMCPRLGMDRPVGLMDQALFSRVIDQLAPHRRWIESVALMGLGEPFLHPQLFDFARQAKAAGLGRLYTSTNATRLTEDNVRRLLDVDAFDQLILSVDGGKQTYERLRPGAPYEVVAEGVRRLLAAKRDRRRPAIELQILLMEETVGEIEPFCETWVPLLGDGDRILVKEVDTFGGQVDDHRLPTYRRRPEQRVPCRQLWKDLSIGWDGQVTVCCKDVLYKLALGNVREQTLVDLWFSRRWNGIRRMHLEGKWDWLDPCNVCQEWWI